MFCSLKCAEQINDTVEEEIYELCFSLSQGFNSYLKNNGECYIYSGVDYGEDG